MLIGDGLTKKYTKTVLCNVNFKCEPGEIIGIAGENGSGKSTLLNILTNVIKPDAGTVSIGGESINRVLLRREISLVPQHSALFENISVLDNFKFWAAAYKIEPNVTGYNKDFLRKKASQLSGGMKRRVSIDIALLHNPNYLFLDEPTSGLDISHKERILTLIQQRKAEQKSVIFTSHHPDELMACDKLYVMKDGKFVFDNAPTELGQGLETFKQALLRLIF